MRLAATWSLLVVAIGAAVLLDGLAPVGRLALRVGLDGLAGQLLEAPHWRGVALYRQGDFDAAAEAFRRAGPRASFNRGNALAFAGDYHGAVAAYEAVIYRDPEDLEARVNRDLIAPLAEPVIGEVRAGGRSEAETTGGAPQVRSQRHEDIVGVLRELYKAKGFTGQSLVASRQWLTTLADEPGRYLKLRLAAERARRIARGLPVTRGEDPW